MFEADDLDELCACVIPQSGTRRARRIRSCVARWLSCGLCGLIIAIQPQCLRSLSHLPALLLAGEFVKVRFDGFVGDGVVLWALLFPRSQEPVDPVNVERTIPGRDSAGAVEKLGETRGRQSAGEGWYCVVRGWNRKEIREIR